MFVKQVAFVAAALVLTAHAHAAIMYASPPASAGLTAYTSTITIKADGSVATVGGGPAFGGEDSFIHVVNNSTASVSGFSLSGNNIFGFDNDGTIGVGGSTVDPGDYAGTLVTFTYSSANLSAGSVNFIGGLAPNSDLYFELEEDVTLTSSGFSVGPVTGTGVPEPTSLALLGTAIVGGVLARRRKRA